jgi:hypothetical protein
MPDLERLAPRIRVLQIIAFALLFGLLVFTGIVLFLRLSGQPIRPVAETPLVTFLAIGMLVMNLPLSVLVPQLNLQAALKGIAAGTWTPSPGRGPAPEYRDDAERLLGVRQTSLIVTLALLEGPGFLGCIAYLVEGSPFALCVPAAVVVAMLLHFPTKWRTLNWIERKLAELDSLRGRGA